MIGFERRSFLDPVAQELVACYLAELRARIPGFDPGRAAPPAAGDFDPPSGVFLVALIEGHAVGCGALRRMHRTAGEIRRMWIRPDRRGEGYGRALLVALEAEARKLGLDTLYLDTNDELAEALGLYRSGGFVDVPPYNDNGHADHWLAKHLTTG